MVHPVCVYQKKSIAVEAIIVLFYYHLTLNNSSFGDDMIHYYVKQLLTSLLTGIFYLIKIKFFLLIKKKVVEVNLTHHFHLCCINTMFLFLYIFEQKKPLMSVHSSLFFWFLLTTQVYHMFIKYLSSKIKTILCDESAQLLIMLALTK